MEHHKLIFDLAHVIQLGRCKTLLTFVEAVVGYGKETLHDFIHALTSDASVLLYICPYILRINFE